MATDVIGWMSFVCLALCAVPQTVKTVRTRSAMDLSWLFLGLWFAGELLGIMYMWGDTERLPVLVNYIANVALISPMLVVKGMER